MEDDHNNWMVVIGTFSGDFSRHMMLIMSRTRGEHWSAGELDGEYSYYTSNNFNGFIKENKTL